MPKTSPAKPKHFDDVIAYLDKEKRPRHLLLGNGFSIAYDKDIFSYNSLSKFVEESDDATLKELFKIVRTRDFEQVMRQLDTFGVLVQKFDGNKALANRIAAARDGLKAKLIEAVQALHPEHVFKVPDAKSVACAKFLGLFLNNGGHVFTTNYDLLLYWVLMRNLDALQVEPSDGFGREPENPDPSIPPEEWDWSPLFWGPNKATQNIHYVHGALPMFDEGYRLVKEEYSGVQYLLESIESRLTAKEYPLFVAAGDGQQKMERIRHDQYLAHCYDRLSSLDGTLIVFGFRFGPSDDHIIQAINAAAKKKVGGAFLKSVYIGVFSPDDEKHIASIQSKFDCPVRLFDAKTAMPWGE